MEVLTKILLLGLIAVVPWALGQNCNCNDFRACVDLADATEKQNGKDCEAKCAVTAFGSKSNDAINCMQEKKALKESMKTQMKNCLFTTGNICNSAGTGTGNGNGNGIGTNTVGKRDIEMISRFAERVRRDGDYGKGGGRGGGRGGGSGENIQEMKTFKSCMKSCMNPQGGQSKSAETCASQAGCNAGNAYKNAKKACKPTMDQNQNQQLHQKSCECLRNVLGKSTTEMQCNAVTNGKW